MGQSRKVVLGVVFVVITFVSAVEFTAKYGDVCDNSTPCTEDANLMCIPPGAGRCQCKVINSVQWVHDPVTGTCVEDPTAYVPKPPPNPFAPGAGEPGPGPHHHYNPNQPPLGGRGRSFGDEIQPPTYRGCAQDRDCLPALGELSKCDLSKSPAMCICYDTVTQGEEPVGEYRGKCWVKVAEGEYCSSHAQCELTENVLKCLAEAPGSYMKRCICQGESCSRRGNQNRKQEISGSLPLAPCKTMTVALATVTGAGMLSLTTIILAKLYAS